MGEDLRNKALLYYISKGLSPQAAAGIVGMLMSESSLSPDSVNASSGAYGLAQWLGPRKRELFRRYGSKPTFDNQLDYTWYEMNNTHKNALKHLNAAQTPEDAAKAAFGYYAFMTGPEGAIKEMEKYGLNGKASLAQKIKYANDVYNWAYGNTFVVHPRYEKYLNPNGKVEKTYIADTLPELVVTGKRPKLTLPSISLSLELAMAKLLLRASGFNPDMPMWEQYAPTYRPLVMPLHYDDGKEGENVHWSDKYNRDDIVNDLIEQYKQSEDFNTPLYERFKKTSAYKKAYKNSQWYADNLASRSLGLPEDDNVPYFLDAFDEWKTTKKAARYTDKLLRRLSEKYATDLNDIFNSIKYIDDYYKLSGIVPRRQDSHPNLYFKYGNVNGLSNLNDSKNSITFGMDFDPLLGGAYGTAAHEYAHYMDPYLKSQQGVPENYNTLYSRRRSDPYNPSDFEDHDSKPSENYADLVGSRGLMYKYGIWDSRNGGEIPMKAVQKFRKKYGNQSRLFRMYDDETIGQMYNTIAYNWPNRLNIPNLV